VTSGEAKSLTIVSLVTAGALASVHAIRDGHLPSVRVPLGGVIVGVVLLTVADGAPDVAGGLALLLLAGSLLTTGRTVLPILTKGVTGS